MSEQVPEGWKLQPLSALAEYHNGRAFKPEDWSKEGLPIVRIAQINDPFRETDYYIGSDVLDRHLIRKGDLVFSWSATLKAILWKEYDAILNQHIFKVIEKPNTSRIFLQQLLEHSIEKLAESSHGSTMKHIKKGVLDEFHSPIPPLPEQKKIASILTSVDEVIEKTQSQFDKLQDLKKGTMNELLTKGIGHTEFKDSELGRIPKSWEVLRTSQLYEFKNGLNKEKEAFGSGQRIVNYMDVFPRSEMTEEDLSGRVQLSQSEIERFAVSSGDLFFTRTSEIPSEIGLSAVITKVTQDVCFSGFILRAKPLNNKIIPKLSGRLYRCDYVRTQIVRTCSYTTRALTNGTSLGRVLVAVPSIEEQEKIYSVLDSIEKNIKNKQLENEKYISQKKSLMQDLLTGKVRVSVN